MMHSSPLPGEDRHPECTWNFLRGLVQRSLIPCWVLSPDGRVLCVNEALSCTFFDCRAALVEGREVHDFLRGRMRDGPEIPHGSPLTSNTLATEIRMLRGFYCRLSYMPIRETTDGPMVLVHIAVADPVASRLIDSHMERANVGVRVEHSMVADLGRFEVLLRDDLRMLRQLAVGWHPDQIAGVLGMPASAVSERLDWIGSTLEWGDLLGLRTHAFACGLHLFDDDYFESVVLQALDS